MVSSLLRLEASRSVEASTRTALKEMQGRVAAMALVHETLYRSGTFGHVRLTLDFASIPMGIDHAIPCGLIVNELLTNSLKHGFASGETGEIKIALHEADGRVRLAVSDTGTGLPEDLDWKKEKSLGLQLVSDLARQLQGALEIGPAPAPVFVVTFPRTRPDEPAGPASESGSIPRARG